MYKSNVSHPRKNKRNFNKTTHCQTDSALNVWMWEVDISMSREKSALLHYGFQNGPFIMMCTKSRKKPIKVTAARLLSLPKSWCCNYLKRKTTQLKNSYAIPAMPSRNHICYIFVKTASSPLNTLSKQLNRLKRPVHLIKWKWSLKSLDIMILIDILHTTECSICNTLNMLDRHLWNTFL